MRLRVRPPVRSCLYGLSITNEQAKHVADAALAPARANGWTVVVAIVDTGGFLVLEKLDQTQVGSIAIAETRRDRRRSSNGRRTLLASGSIVKAIGMIVLGLRGAVPVEGGLPIVVDGKLIGALGVSGGSSAEDEVCAEAGAAALK
jgi:uncharacterized protein GlcG (DUF336 family)